MPLELPVVVVAITVLFADALRGRRAAAEVRRLGRELERVERCEDARRARDCAGGSRPRGSLL